MYPTWYNCLQGGWTWQDFGDCNTIPQCFGRAQICHFCVKNVVFMIAWKHSWHWWEVVEEVSLKHKHYSRVRYPLLGRGREQLLQFSLKAQQKQADLNWKLHKSTMTCVESLTLGLQKVRNCDKTTFCDKIVYIGGAHFRSRPCGPVVPQLLAACLSVQQGQSDLRCYIWKEKSKLIVKV